MAACKELAKHTPPSAHRAQPSCLYLVPELPAPADLPAQVAACTLAAREDDSDDTESVSSPPPGPDTRERLLMDTPPEGWDAYYAAHNADKEVSESQKKKPAQGAGSSRLITDDKPLSPVARQPDFDA